MPINTIVYCVRCNDLELSENIMYFHENSGSYYCPDCWNGLGMSNDNDNNESENNENEFNPRPLDLLNTTFKHLRYKRCFGIELEVSDKNLEYDEIQSYTCFGNKRDGSISCGSELYSPILQGDLGFEAVRKLCNIIKNSQIDKSTGYHLHIDARELNYRDIKKIWMTYNIFEGVLFSMLPPSRNDNRYCKKSQMPLSKIKEVYSLQNLKSLWYSQSDDTDRTYHYNQTRYLGFNLHSYFYQSTIEIRHHSGTVDFDKIMNWIKINQAIVNYALAHNENEISDLLNFENCTTNYTRIRKLFKEVVQSNVLWEYYKQRFQKFNKNEIYGYYNKENNNG